MESELASQESGPPGLLSGFRLLDARDEDGLVGWRELSELHRVDACTSIA